MAVGLGLADYGQEGVSNYPGTQGYGPGAEGG